MALRQKFMFHNYECAIMNYLHSVKIYNKKMITVCGSLLIKNSNIKIYRKSL